MDPGANPKRKRVEPPLRELSKECKANFKRPPPPVNYAELARRLKGTGLDVPHRQNELLRFQKINGNNAGNALVDNTTAVPTTSMGTTNFPTYRYFPRDECEFYWMQLNINVPADHKHLLPDKLRDPETNVVPRKGALPINKKKCGNPALLPLR
jgi:hypothetical protein